jgi:hypothetical protein
MQEQIIAGLVARGMPEHIARGFAMNFADESAFNPTAVGDNGNAYGLAQWNGPRKAALEAFAANTGRSAADPNVQLDYLMTELQGPEAGAWGKIAAAPDANSAAAAVLNYFERPAEAHRARREADYLGGTRSALPSTYAPQQTPAGLLTTPMAQPDPMQGLSPLERMLAAGGFAQDAKAAPIANIWNALSGKRGPVTAQGQSGLSGLLKMLGA